MARIRTPRVGQPAAPSAVTPTSCTAPPGTIAAVERGTGRITGQLHTDELPDRSLYKACGNSRESVCPGCAWVYRGDA